MCVCVGGGQRGSKRKREKKYLAQKIKFQTSNCPLASFRPCVVVHYFALRLDKRVIDDLQVRVDDGHASQLQALLGVALGTEMRGDRSIRKGQTASAMSIWFTRRAFPRSLYGGLAR